MRLSGPEAFAVASRLMDRLPEERLASLRVLRDLEGEVIDEALVIVFGAGASFTGEPTVEFQTHGSLSVVSKLAHVLGSFDGVRQAEAGEFTKRALVNERLSLLQVENLADLISAESELQRVQAVHGFSGQAGQRVEAWRKDLLRALALLEAAIDFSEEDIPSDVSEEVWSVLDSLMAGLKADIDGFVASDAIRSGFEVAIVGRPNVGKSTLLNFIAGRDVAITSEIAGTTRDVLEVRVDLNGCLVTFLDTAGLRVTEDAIEELGVSRARERARNADLRIHLIEPDGEPIVDVVEDDIVVVSKSDLYQSGGVSGLTGEGVGGLLSTVSRICAGRVAGSGVLTRQRHVASASEALQFVEQSRAHVLNGDVAFVFASEDLRSAVRSLDALVGRIGVEDVLGEIFSSFCIGK